ncbi:MAG: hypothetical protein ACP5UM_14390 [Anaerolineae bacterium]
MGTLIRWIRENLLLILVVGVLAGGYFFLRTEPSDLGSMAELEALLQGDRPVLVELYLNT